MKMTTKNMPILLRVMLLCMVVGTLAWELIARLLVIFGVDLDLSVGPIGFDIHVVALWFRVNPGTLAGLVPALLIARRM